ncbi:MAG TPA: hypothetical protein VEL76_30170 [Gemmataceae bacterium]|nr:hypothetical protein [Gemmataceae bacterium]
MITATVEQRLEALEQTVTQLKALQQVVAELKAQLSQQLNGPATNGGPAKAGEEQLLPDVEYPTILDVPPLEEYEVRARIVSIEQGRQDLALSDAEWASLQLEAEDE